MDALLRQHRQHQVQTDPGFRQDGDLAKPRPQEAGAGQIVTSTP
jgi:hypothetical protein